MNTSPADDDSPTLLASWTLNQLFAWVVGEPLGATPEAALQRLSQALGHMTGALASAVVLSPAPEAEYLCVTWSAVSGAEALPDFADLTRGLLAGVYPVVGEANGEGLLPICRMGASRADWAVLGLPIHLVGEARGVLWLVLPASRQPAPEHYPSLMLIADYALSRAHAAHLLADRTERVARLNGLIATIKHVAQSLELEEILPEIIKDASQLLNAASGDIVLWDRERGVLRVVAVYSFAPDMLQFEMPLGEGLTSQAMASRRPVMVPDYLAYPRRVKALERYQFKAVLSVPLISRGEAIGAINVHSERVGYRYSEDDISLLAAFADHAAVAIDHAQRYESEKRMVVSLRELSAVIKQQNESLSQSLAIQQQFTQQALHGRGLLGLAQRLAAIVGRPVTIEDPFFHMLTSARPDGQACPEFGLPADLQRDPLFRAEIAQIVQTRRPTPVASSPGRLMAPLLAAEDVLGYLSVLPGEAALSELGLVAVELAATNCTLELLKQRAALEAEARLRGDFVLDLISGNYPNREAVMTRAGFLGYNLSHTFELVVFDIDNFAALARTMTEREVVRLKQQVYETARRFLVHKSPQSLVAAQSDALIFLLSRAPAGEGGIGETPALGLVQAVRRELAAAFPQVSVSAALGEACCAPPDFQRAHEAARAALDLMKSFGKTGQVIDTRELGFYGLLLQASGKGQLAAYARSQLQPLRDYDARHRTALLATLQLYFKHGSQKKQAADAAFLHVNTLAYRLRKAQEILAADLHNPDDLLRLQFAFKVMDVLPVWD